MRVVSLVPSATETLLALGADVVACTRFCEQPGLPHVGGTKNPDIDAVVALSPDLVVLDEEENRREDAAALAARGVELLVTAVRSVADAQAAVAVLAARSGRPLDRPLAMGAPDAPGAPGAPDAPDAPDAVRVRAFVPVWRRPWMTLNDDTYGASLLAAVGVELVTAGLPDRYPVVELADVAASAPDLVLVPSEPYTFRDSHVAELGAAFPGATVQRVDGRDLFWWGIRTPAAAARLRAVLTSGPASR